MLFYFGGKYFAYLSCKIDLLCTDLYSTLVYSAAILCWTKNGVSMTTPASTIQSSKAAQTANAPSIPPIPSQFQMSDTLVIIFFVALLAGLMTYIIPIG